MLLAMARRLIATGALLVIAAACSPDPKIDERPVYVYSPRGCPVVQSDAFGVFYAAGDFQATSDAPPYASVFLGNVGAVMTALPHEARSLLVDISQRGDLRWSGLAEIGAAGPVNVLVWPRAVACDLTRNVEERTETTLGVFGRHVMVVGGKNDGGPVPRTYVGDLSTGAMEALDLGLLVKRSRPTVTPFRASHDELPSPALVAGGEDPDGNPIDTAEVYVPKPGVRGELGDFDRSATIRLSDARASHGAVVLANGSTLLVGGIGRNGRPLRSMEIVDPVSRQSRSDGVEQLAFARKAPTVLCLANGEIMVAGGTDASGNPVRAIEWFSPDVTSKRKRPVDLVTGRERSIVPLPAGGALAVVAPEDRAATSFQTVYVISAEGSIEAAVPLDPAELDRVRLFEGANGAPVLWTGRRWMRWQPWVGAFSPILDAPAAGPDGDAFASGDSGLALWMRARPGAPGVYVAGFRFDVKGRFESLTRTLLAGGTGGLVPDRLPGDGTSIVFSPSKGLSLGPGATVTIPDLTFADFHFELEVVDAAPEVVLSSDRGAVYSVGGAECAFAQAAERKLTVDRSGKRVHVRVDDRDPRECPLELDASSRVAVGLRGASGSASSGGRNLVLHRR